MPLVPRPRALCADSSEDIRALVGCALSAAGIDVCPAADGDEAERLALAHDFDLIVLDIFLPGRDGFEVCARLRKRGVRCPVLFFASDQSEDSRRRALSAGAQGYVLRPLGLADLAELARETTRAA